MIRQLSDNIQDFPIQDYFCCQGKFFMIKDTFDISGNFIISSMLNHLLKNGKKILFIGANQNYAHYVNTSKKLGSNIENFINKNQLLYYDLFSFIMDYVPQDLPFTEETSQNWLTPSKNVKKFTLQTGKEKEFSLNLIKDIEEQIKTQAIDFVIFDNCSHLLNILYDDQVFFSFFTDLLIQQSKYKNNLVGLFTCLPDEKLMKMVNILENHVDYMMEVFQNPSGFQKDIYGQLITKIEEKVYKFLIEMSENKVNLLNSYGVKN